ncbi:hypothetical protein, partial [Rhizobium leguminosarum]|uniref:hypothetical protein n=1 Tax=Rhizobium leguminosarum TaxID=384 RepID=UPI003D050FBF
ASSWGQSVAIVVVTRLSDGKSARFGEESPAFLQASGKMASSSHSLLICSESTSQTSKFCS